MTIKFQYNKTALQSLNKQLNIREKALPTLKNKEAALRVEVKKAKDKTQALSKELSEKINQQEASFGLWNEFIPDIVSVASIETSSRKIAGVKIPVMEKVVFDEKEFSLFNQTKWLPEGISVLKDLGRIILEKKFFRQKMELLDHARKKTTQKVNLYEKVQIPEYEDAIRKIKRFLEDEENLSKSAQKIVKKRQEKQREEAAV